MVYPALGMPFCLFLSVMIAILILVDRIAHPYIESLKIDPVT